MPKHNQQDSSPEGRHTNEADFDADLHHNNQAGENRGKQVDYSRSAADIKELNGFRGMSNGELNEVVLVPTGSRLEQGATYLNLSKPEQGTFVATSEMVAEPGNYLVAKKALDYVIWNRLTGVTNEDRINESPSV